MANNPFYLNIQIDHQNLDALPQNGIPDNLNYVEYEDRSPPGTSVTSSTDDLPPDVPTESRSLLPLPQSTTTEQEAIRNQLAGPDPIDWPTTAGEFRCRSPPSSHMERLIQQTHSVHVKSPWLMPSGTSLDTLRR